MHIKTREELINHLKTTWEASRSGDYGTLYESSPTHSSKVKRIELGSDVVIGIHPYHANSEFVFYGEKHQSFSLADAGVTETTYNDWRLFTTEEEAENYRRPKQFVVGEKYRWDPSSDWHQPRAGMGGPLECVFVDKDQAVFKSERYGNLHIITVLHLRSKAINKIS